MPRGCGPQHAVAAGGDPFGDRIEVGGAAPERRQQDNTVPRSLRQYVELDIAAPHDGAGDDGRHCR